MLPIFISVLVITLLSLVGALGLLGLSESRLRRTVPLLVALAAGALLSDSALHLLPESFAHSEDAGFWILVGLLGFFLIESLIHWHHHGGGHVHEDHNGALVAMNLLGDGVHNFIDGGIIAATWMVAPEAGLATTIAIALHEIPQEFGDFGVLLHAGLSPKKALALNLLSGCAALLGAAMAIWVNQPFILVPIAAGGFLYIACADLVPELHKRVGGRIAAVAGAMIIGAVLVWGLPLISSGDGHSHGTVDCEDCGAHDHGHSHGD